MAIRQTVDAVARTGEVAAESAKQMVRSTAEVAQRVATAPMSTGSVLWDSMFNLWTAPLGRAVARPTNGLPSSQAEEVIPLAEETLVVGKQTVTSGTTTVRRVVVETPVQQQVSLYDEKVIVERRKPVTDAVTGETLTEVTIEMIETSESARGWQEREGAGRGRRAPGTHPTDRDRAGHRPSGRDRDHSTPTRTIAPAGRDRQSPPAVSKITEATPHLAHRSRSRPRPVCSQPEPACRPRQRLHRITRSLPDSLHASLRGGCTNRSASSSHGRSPPLSG